MTDFCPTAADMPAKAAPAFPVEAVTTISALISRARVTTTALALSLNEAVGLWLSSLIHNDFIPSVFDNNTGEKIGVPPTARNGVSFSPGSETGSNGKYRHNECSRFSNICLRGLALFIAE